jgi:tetratricopeptide (TPR) repeat protein
MQVTRLMLRQWIIAVALILVVFGLIVWAIRPSPVSEWSRAEGFEFDPPFTVVAEWAHGRLAPMTPVGFVTLFSPAELGVLLALLAALSVFILGLTPRWGNQGIGSWLSRPILSLRLPRIGLRVRTAMVLIAVFGLYLGWEMATWRTWRLSDRYRRLATEYALKEYQSRQSLKGAESVLARFDFEIFDFERGPEYATPSARAAVKAYNHDVYRRGAALFTAQCAAYAELKLKYERAAARPSLLLPPDPAIPEEQHSIPNVDWSNWGGYVRSPIDYDELIRRYPDLYWAHERKAWILATSPDATYRDGRLAVAAATRANELTNGKDGRVLSTLAAAYAEIGDFASAVRWQERALERVAAEGRISKPEQDRLSLYKSAKPFRLPR